VNNWKLEPDNDPDMVFEVITVQQDPPGAGWNYTIFTPRISKGVDKADIKITVTIDDIDYVSTPD